MSGGLLGEYIPHQVDEKQENYIYKREMSRLKAILPFLKFLIEILNIEEVAFCLRRNAKPLSRGIPQLDLSSSPPAISTFAPAVFSRNKTQP